MLPIWLGVGCKQGCVNMGVRVIEIYVYGSYCVVLWGCYVGSVVCGCWGIFCSGWYPGSNVGDA